MLKRYNGEDVASVSPTVGFNIKSLEFRGFTLNVWDVGGQQTIRAYWRNYFEQTDGVVWVVDSVDRWRLEDCRRELFALLSQEVSGQSWRCGCLDCWRRLLNNFLAVVAETRWCVAADLGEQAGLARRHELGGNFGGVAAERRGD